MADTAPTLTNGASASNGDATRGLAYYEKLRRDLRDTLNKKRILDKNLVSTILVFPSSPSWLRFNHPHVCAHMNSQKLTNPTEGMSLAELPRRSNPPLRELVP